MPPPNTSAATATDLGVLPASVTQDVNDSGTTFTVWYKYTPALADNNKVKGFFFFGDLVNYTAQVTVWLDPLGSPVNYLSLFTRNKPFQMPVVFGETYYFEVESQFGNVSPAILNITGYDAPEDPYSIGSFLINDDTDGFPAAILNSSNGKVLQFKYPFPAGERAAILADGTMCFYDSGSSNFKIYDNEFNLVATVTFAGTGSGLVSSNKVDTFYIGRVGSSIAAGTLTTCSTTGTLGGTTWTLPVIANGVKGFSPNLDETILYYVGNGVNVPVKRYDLPGDAPLSDFLGASGAGVFVGSDILILDDGTIVIGTTDSATFNSIKRYDSSAVLQNTYTPTFPPTYNRMAYAVDDPNSFWVWLQTSTHSTFINIKVRDGTELANFTIVRYNGGVYAAAATATPEENFGHDNSCPLIVLRAASPPTPGESGIFKIVTNKRNDVGLAIPAPTFKTALMP